MKLLNSLTQQRLLRCLNPQASRSRLFWYTGYGRTQYEAIRREINCAPVSDPPRDIPWDLYGWVCFSHRAAILKAMHQPMQPSAIKRRARYLDPDIRMSANNVRDAVRLLAGRGVVKAVELQANTFTHYSLTPMGGVFRDLLCRASDPSGPLTQGKSPCTR